MFSFELSLLLLLIQLDTDTSCSYRLMQEELSVSLSILSEPLPNVVFLVVESDLFVHSLLPGYFVFNSLHNSCGCLNSELYRNFWRRILVLS